MTPDVCFVRVSPPRYIIVVEHDLSVLDYLSDFICCLYGVPSAYGVVTMPFGVREGTLPFPSAPTSQSSASRRYTIQSSLGLALQATLCASRL